MNLSNVNQLQELIAIKVTELLAKKQKFWSYLEREITEQNKLDLVKKGVFKHITLHCMVTRGVLSQNLVIQAFKEKKKGLKSKSPKNESGERKERSHEFLKRFEKKQSIEKPQK